MTEFVLKSPPRCARCGAPLPAADRAGKVTCVYCRAEYVTHRAPAARGRHDYAPGDAVLVKWGDDFWDARVLAKVGDRRWRIRYDGYDATSDEVVGPGRIRPRDEADADEDLDDAAQHDDDDARTEGAELEAAAAHVAQDSTAFPRGAKVDVAWNGRWYDGTVKRVLGPGRWVVGYDGWSTSWDEAVSPDRIRPRTRKANRRVVTVAVVAMAVVAMLIAGGFASFVLRRPTGADGQPTAGATPTGAPTGAPGMPVPDAEALRVGQAISVEWRGSWFAATVVAIVSKDTVRIHYVGWSDQWDETVPLGRVRVP